MCLLVALSSLSFQLECVFVWLPSSCPLLVCPLSRRRSWLLGRGILIMWRVWKRTLSTPFPWPPSQTKASGPSLTNWCRGLHKPVRLNLTGVTHRTCRHTQIPQMFSISQTNFMQMFCPLHANSTRFIVLVKPGEPSLPLSIYLVYQPICPTPLPSIYLRLTVPFLLCSSLSLSYTAKTSWQMEMERRLMFHSSFSSSCFTFSTLSVSNVFERLKLSGVYWLAANGEEH